MPEWWQLILVTMVTINTIINIIVFFKHRFRQSYGKKNKPSKAKNRTS